VYKLSATGCSANDSSVSELQLRSASSSVDPSEMGVVFRKRKSPEMVSALITCSVC
jgi:hypothetical protein